MAALSKLNAAGAGIQDRVRTSQYNHIEAKRELSIFGILIRRQYASTWGLKELPSLAVVRPLYYTTPIIPV